MRSRSSTRTNLATVTEPLPCSQRRRVSVSDLLRAIEPSNFGLQPFDEWEIHDLVHLDDDLLETYGRDFSHGGPNA
jgi:hypothetical protein